MRMPSSGQEQLHGEGTTAGLSSAIQNRVNPSSRKKEKGSRPRRRSTALSLPVKPPMRQRNTPTDIGKIDALTQWVVRNQIQISLALLSCLATVHVAAPELRPAVRKFYTVSYHNPETGRFGKGYDDGYLVLFWIVIFTFMRSCALDYVFIPLAQRSDINSTRGRVRFAEQAWMLVYYTFFWSLGMYLVYNSPYWMNVKQLWTDWPLRELDGLFKWYYLVQFAFWLQQIFVLNIEERRKDHYQMYAHHIITCSLIATSYGYHMTRVGNVILCMMDFVDILLPAAKLLKYSGYHTVCDYAFGLFLVSWVITRHLLYNRIVYSAWKDSVQAIPFACFSSNSSAVIPLPEQEPNAFAFQHSLSYSSDLVCFTKTIQMSFISLLVALQVITLVWLYMIMAVAWRVVKGVGADDTRSDDEDDNEDDEEAEEVELNGNGVALKSNGAALPVATLMNGHTKSRHISSQD